MVYIIGPSSGMFMAAEGAEKHLYATIPLKAFYGAFKGAKFTQIDIESITEFNEPYLKEEIEKIRRMGIRFGIHGESYAMGGTEKPISMMDSAVQIEYIHCHQRLLQHIEGAGKIGAEFINVHPSETAPFIRLGMHLGPSKLVDPWGRPFNDFIDENPALLDWALSKPFVTEILFRGAGGETPIVQWATERRLEEIKDYKLKRGEPITAEEVKEVGIETKKRYEKHFKEGLISNDLSYGIERVAYYILAKWMQMTNHPLWNNIVGKKIPDEKLTELAFQHTTKSWVPAVSALYIAGHFNPKKSTGYKDPKPLLNKYKVCFVFETQMGGGGLEGLSRIVRPRDMIEICKYIKSPFVGVCFDFEHVLASNIDPVEEIKSIKHGDAKWMRVAHLGWPQPHAPGHLPIGLGTREHVYLYERLYELRKKGFKDGFLIFERGGGQDPIRQSMHAIRLIKQFLEKETPPKELPEEFFGMPKGGWEIRRQEVAVREHFMDPIKGMLQVPEEEYTFLSKAAAEKGKAKEWGEEKYT